MWVITTDLLSGDIRFNIEHCCAFLIFILDSAHIFWIQRIWMCHDNWALVDEQFANLREMYSGKIFFEDADRMGSDKSPVVITHSYTFYSIENSHTNT